MPILKRLLQLSLCLALWISVCLFSGGSCFSQHPALADGPVRASAQPPDQAEEPGRAPAQQDAQQDEQGQDWSNFQTAYFTVYYKPEVNLKRVLGRLSGRGLPAYSNLPAYTLTGIEAKVAYRLDTIFTRVKDILGMYPDGIEIKIKIYKNRQNINVELCYLNQADGTCKSFYIYRFNTIYASEQDMTDSVIAHEMAHAVVDNYFSTTPPGKMAEILATNVDVHLDD